METTDARRIAAALTDAWNAADAEAFGRAFTDDADFVNIFGRHDIGREAIVQNHAMIFGTIYRESTNAFTVVKERRVGAADAIVALIAADVQVPHGAMAGGVRTLATAVLVREDDGWKIASFQNTRIQPPPNARAAAD